MKKYLKPILISQSMDFIDIILVSSNKDDKVFPHVMTNDKSSKEEKENDDIIFMDMLDD